jgi:hypothetical protein
MSVAMLRFVHFASLKEDCARVPPKKTTTTSLDSHNLHGAEVAAKHQTMHSQRCTSKRETKPTGKEQLKYTVRE